MLVQPGALEESILKPRTREHVPTLNSPREIRRTASAEDSCKPQKIKMMIRIRFALTWGNALARRMHSLEM